MATTYPQQGGYQQTGGGQPVVLQVIQQQKSSSDSFLKVCGCVAGTGLAIFIGIIGGFLVMIGSIILGVDADDMMTTGIVLLSIGGFLLIGSCFACSHFRKELNNDNNASGVLIAQQQAGQVYTQPQAAPAGQPLISPVVPQPPPGAGYPGPQMQPPPGAAYPGPHHQPPPGAVYPGPQQPQQYPMPPPGYSAPGPVPQQSYGPGYIPGQIGGTIPEQPAHLTKASEAAASAPMPPVDQTSEYDRPPAYAP